MKVCTECKKSKKLKDFYVRKTGNRAGEYYEKCKDCCKKRGRKYYHLNKDIQLPKAILRKHKAYKIKSDYIKEIKNVPCMDCGKRYPHFVMDFDHREGKSKEANVASMVTRNWSLNKIKKEIDKCDIICANCHRIRTYQKG